MAIQTEVKQWPDIQIVINNICFEGKVQLEIV